MCLLAQTLNTFLGHNAHSPTGLTKRRREGRSSRILPFDRLYPRSGSLRNCKAHKDLVLGQRVFFLFDFFLEISWTVCVIERFFRNEACTDGKAKTRFRRCSFLPDRGYPADSIPLDIYHTNLPDMRGFARWENHLCELEQGGPRTLLRHGKNKSARFPRCGGQLSTDLNQATVRRIIHKLKPMNQFLVHSYPQLRLRFPPFFFQQFKVLSFPH